MSAAELMTEDELGFEIDRLTQVIAEDTYSRKNIQDAVRDEITGDLEGLKVVYDACISAVLSYLAGSYYESKNNRIEWIKYVEPEAIVIELFVHVIPNEGPVSIQKVAGQFAPWFEYEDIFDGVRTAAEILGACWKCDLYTLIDAADSEDKYINIRSNWCLDDDTRDFIERSRYLDPMLAKPKEWRNNIGGGYITTKNSVILGKHKHHNEQQALDVLNMLQEIEWSLDEDIVMLGEVSSKKLDTRVKQKAFQQMLRLSEEVRNTMLEAGNVFHFSWRMDFRGRMYSDGHYVNFQSNSFRKAQLNFTEKRLIV